MKTQIEELNAAADSVFKKYSDAELRDFMLGVAKTLQASEAMYHQFGYLLTHVRATVAHPSRSAHLQSAIEGAQKFIKRYEEQQAAGRG